MKYAVQKTKLSKMWKHVPLKKEGRAEGSHSIYGYRTQGRRPILSYSHKLWLNCILQNVKQIFV